MADSDSQASPQIFENSVNEQPNVELPNSNTSPIIETSPVVPTENTLPPAYELVESIPEKQPEAPKQVPTITLVPDQQAEPVKIIEPQQAEIQPLASTSSKKEEKLQEESKSTELKTLESDKSVNDTNASSSSALDKKGSTSDKDKDKQRRASWFTRKLSSAKNKPVIQKPGFARNNSLSLGTEPIGKEGWLKIREGKIFKSLKLVWAVADNITLIWYKDEKLSLQKGKISLTGTYIGPLQTGTFEDSSTSFEIYSPETKEFTFKGENSDDAKMWIYTLRTNAKILETKIQEQLFFQSIPKDISKSVTGKLLKVGWIRERQIKYDWKFKFVIISDFNLSFYDAIPETSQDLVDKAIFQYELPYCRGRELHPTECLDERKYSFLVVAPSGKIHYMAVENNKELKAWLGLVSSQTRIMINSFSDEPLQFKGQMAGKPRILAVDRKNGVTLLDPENNQKEVWNHSFRHVKSYVVVELGLELDFGKYEEKITLFSTDEAHKIANLLRNLIDDIIVEEKRKSLFVN